ncbi:Di-copper centre-containing [Lecanosticta acicola]|uniref:tyrosinase n=1 Tax=Lecanosticta acicola TaxID=111012 RepID=A0AAI9E8J8_9PEZI|nr:Di-copper centre-containing [Lecanosticta acicola]
MHFSSPFSSLLLIAASAVAHDAHNNKRHDALHAQQLHSKRQDSGVVITSGAQGFGDDQTHARLEISDLAANRPDQWTLFILAMQKFQLGSQNSSTSYFGVASIHGVPRQDWDGVTQCEQCAGSDGYCTHDSVLFPAWHRAYMALYEQEFLNVALEVANSYTGTKKDEMVTACSTLRFPYWDWAATPDEGQSTLPAVITSPSVTVDGPNGQQTIANPLYSYDIGAETDDMYYSPFTSWQNTLRYPTSNDADATSDDATCTTAFDSIRQNMQDQIYQLLSTCDDYLHFSNDDAGSSDAACSNSLEGIHNTIHTTAGGAGSTGVSGGHMTYLPLASFDPIFWLHHANVDRFFAIWQTLHPDSYGASQTAPHATWTVASGSTQDADSPLEPYRKDASTFWTTNDVKDWTIFKYTYPEFLAGDGSKASVAAFVNQLYGSSANSTASSISKQVEHGDDKAPVSSSSSSVAPKRTIVPVSQGSSAFSNATSATESAPFPTTTGTATGLGKAAGPTSGASASGSGFIGNNSTVSPSFKAPNGSEYQYVCNVQTPRYGLNGSYYVYVFDGQPKNNNSNNWINDKNMIGAIGVLAGGDMVSPHLKVSGSVPLTRHLQEKCKSGALTSMSEKHAVPYLTKNLNWKIVRAGQEVHPNSVPGFQSSVYSGTSAPAGKNSLPVWSALQAQTQVTKNKAGGAKIAPSGGYASGPSSSGSGVNGTAPGGYSSGPSSSGSGVNGTAPIASAPAGNSPAGYSPSSTSAGAYGSTPSSSSSGVPASYTGAASKASSMGLAGLLVAAGVAAVL